MVSQVVSEPSAGKMVLNIAEASALTGSAPRIYRGRFSAGRFP